MGLPNVPKWIIRKINKLDFEKKLNDSIVIKEQEHYPKAYYTINEEKMNISLLIEQTYVGVDTINYLNIQNTNICIFALTFSICVFDWFNKIIIETFPLSTCCQKIIYRTNNVYLICETEVIIYSIISLKCIGKQEMTNNICDVRETNDQISVILDDCSETIIT